MQLDDAIQFALGGQERAARAESPPAHLTDLLSAREREVMALIERKLTNREIAAQLGVARRTVDTHVSRILNKLGLASRAQVAR
jgi:non-specific serine/threonine protein kinase